MSRTVVLGIDGLGYDQWKELSDAGVMPYSQELLNEGIGGRMQSSIPEVSSTAWSSIVTGRDPGNHNVYGFTDIIDGSYTMAFTSSRTRKSPSFWQRDDGRTNLIINVPQTYPAQPLSGVIVSGYVALDLNQAVFPQTYLPYLQDSGYQIDADMSLAQEDKDVFINELFSVMKTREKALDHLWREVEWDTLMYVITSGDRLNHYCWDDYLDTSSPRHERYLEFHAGVDASLARIVKRLDDDDTLVIVSDHGFGPQNLSVNVNSILQQQGYLELEAAERPSFMHMKSESRAFSLDPGRIYLHRKGRYPKGNVDEDSGDELLDELEDLFQAMEVDGVRIVSDVIRGRDIYDGPYAHRAPDLILMASDGVSLSSRLGIPDIKEEAPFTGKHTFPDATFFYRGPEAVEMIEPFKVEDVVPLMDQVGALTPRV